MAWTKFFVFNWSRDENFSGKRNIIICFKHFLFDSKSKIFYEFILWDDEDIIRNHSNTFFKIGRKKNQNDLGTFLWSILSNLDKMKLEAECRMIHIFCKSSSMKIIQFKFQINSSVCRNTHKRQEILIDVSYLNQVFFKWISC